VNLDDAVVLETFYNRIEAEIAAPASGLGFMQGGDRH
jgi:hypothetical protein